METSQEGCVAAQGRLLEKYKQTTSLIALPHAELCFIALGARGDFAVSSVKCVKNKCAGGGMPQARYDRDLAIPRISEDYSDAIVTVRDNPAWGAGNPSCYVPRLNCSSRPFSLFLGDASE